MRRRAGMRGVRLKRGATGRVYGPMNTVGQPITITPPCAVLSPMRAAIRKLMNTVGEPLTMISGGPTQSAWSVTRAAGRKPIKTVGAHGGRIGPPTCGIGGVPGVAIGQVCMSVIRAAGGMVTNLSAAFFKSKLVLLAGLKTSPYFRYTRRYILVPFEPSSA